ncbi:MAG: glycosyltransferase [Lachnospiraceae bacterium]|nr:glycosyltransferase [Lachnospiraceae bacterium]
MKILYMEWPAYGSEYIRKELKAMGHELVIYEFPHRDEGLRYGEGIAESIVKEAVKNGSELIFSLNFFPVIAVAAHALRIRYISWVYDSPAVLTYAMPVFLPEVYLFHFDSFEVSKLKAAGVENVFYMSLAADTAHYDAIRITPEDEGRYAADIAMTGSMYSEDKFAIFKKYENFDDHTKGYLEALICAQEKIYGADIMEPALTPDIMEKILKSVPLMAHEDSFDTVEWVFANYYMAKKVTSAEREHVLKALSEKYETALYTREETPSLPRVINRGWVDYYTEFPKTVKCAKINLNISLKSIHSGIPLRVIDLMACGGFVLSNYQEDLCRDFIPGEDFVYYESKEDAVEKAGYYLEHEDERIRIARNGYEKVKRQNNFRKKISEMLEV